MPKGNRKITEEKQSETLQGGTFTLECQECSKEFSARRKIQRWCCTACQYEGKKRYERERLNIPEHVEYRKQNTRRWKKANPERVKESNNKSRLKQIDSIKDKRYAKQYGISTEIFNELFEKQDNKCAVCLRSPREGERSFHVDHSHKKSNHVPIGAIRGILCNSCNHRFIGRHVEPELFERAAEYLKQHTGYFVPEDKIKPKRRKRRHK